MIRVVVDASFPFSHDVVIIDDLTLSAALCILLALVGLCVKFIAWVHSRFFARDELPSLVRYDDDHFRRKIRFPYSLGKLKTCGLWRKLTSCSNVFKGRDGLSLSHRKLKVQVLGPASSPALDAFESFFESMDIMIEMRLREGNHPHALARLCRDVFERMLWADLDDVKTCDVGGNSHRHGKAETFPHCLEPTTCVHYADSYTRRGRRGPNLRYCEHVARECDCSGFVMAEVLVLVDCYHGFVEVLDRWKHLRAKTIRCLYHAADRVTGQPTGIMQASAQCVVNDDHGRREWSVVVDGDEHAWEHPAVNAPKMDAFSFRYNGQVFNVKVLFRFGGQVAFEISEADPLLPLPRDDRVFENLLKPRCGNTLTVDLLFLDTADTEIKVRKLRRLILLRLSECDVLFIPILVAAGEGIYERTLFAHLHLEIYHYYLWLASWAKIRWPFLVHHPHWHLDQTHRSYRSSALLGDLIEVFYVASEVQDLYHVIVEFEHARYSRELATHVRVLQVPRLVTKELFFTKWFTPAQLAATEDPPLLLRNGHLVHDDPFEVMESDYIVVKVLDPDDIREMKRQRQCPAGSSASSDDFRSTEGFYSVVATKDSDSDCSDDSENSLLQHFVRPLRAHRGGPTFASAAAARLPPPGNGKIVHFNATVELTDEQGVLEFRLDHSLDNPPVDGLLDRLHLLGLTNPFVQGICHRLRTTSFSDNKDWLQDDDWQDQGETEENESAAQSPAALPVCHDTSLLPVQISLADHLSERYCPATTHEACADGICFGEVHEALDWFNTFMVQPSFNVNMRWHENTKPWLDLPHWQLDEAQVLCFYLDGSADGSATGAAVSLWCWTDSWHWAGALQHNLDQATDAYHAEVMAHVLALKWTHDILRTIGKRWQHPPEIQFCFDADAPAGVVFGRYSSVDPLCQKACALMQMCQTAHGVPIEAIYTKAHAGDPGS